MIDVHASIAFGDLLIEHADENGRVHVGTAMSIIVAPSNRKKLIEMLMENNVLCEPKQHPDEWADTNPERKWQTVKLYRVVEP